MGTEIRGFFVMNLVHVGRTEFSVLISSLSLRKCSNVIDFDRLKLGVPYMLYDLPTEARRLMQDAEGYVATIKSGQVIYREGQSAGALPGRLVRGRQAAPQALAAE